MVREKPYQGLKCKQKSARNGGCLSRTVYTGAAWLPSARGLNCSLKWGNERNPHRVLQVSRETAQPNEYEIKNISRASGWEEGEDDARSACPFDILGYTHNTMAITTRSDEATLS